MDADNCGVIRLDELLAYFKIKKTVLTEKIFEDKESKYPFFLNFEQFVVYTWQFLTLSLEKVATFAFHLLDIKKTGFLSQDSIRYLIELMHNKTIEESKDIQKLVKQCSNIYGNDKLSRAQFETFSEGHRMLCDPFRRTQIAYQSKLLGRVIWKRMRLQREAADSFLVREIRVGNQVEDDVADALLAKFRRERRLNTSLVELEERTLAQETMLQEMMNESASTHTDPSAVKAEDGRIFGSPKNKQVSKREIQLETAELESEDRIILPAEGVIRAPKSSSLHRTPLLIPTTEGPTKKKKKKKKKTFGIRKSTSYSENESKGDGCNRRRSLNDSPHPLGLIQDISNVELFKSTSADNFEEDDANTKINANSSPKPQEGTTANSTSSNVNNKKQSVKQGSILPF